MPYEIDAHSGGVWISGTGIQKVTANERLLVTVANDAGAPGHLVVTDVTFSGGSKHFVELFIDPTGNLPTTVKNVHNAVIDGRVYGGYAVVRADTSNDAFSGGMRSDAVVGVGPDTFDKQFELHIPPGHTLGLQTTLQPGLNDIALSFAFVETS